MSTRRRPRVGEGVAVELRLSGRRQHGALADIRSFAGPRTVRAYLERVDEQVATTEGRVGGTKTFRYLRRARLGRRAGARPRSATPTSIWRRTATRSSAPGRGSLPVTCAGGNRPPPPRCHPRCCEEDGPRARLAAGARRARLGLARCCSRCRRCSLSLRGRLPLRRAGAAGSAAARLRSRGAPRRSSTPAADARARSRPPLRAALAAAVRAAGADAELAARVAAVRDRLLARRYGPARGRGRRRDARRRGRTRWSAGSAGGHSRGVAAGAARAPLACSRSRGLGRRCGPEPRRRSSSTRAARSAPRPTASRRRAAAEPAVAAHWYNLGAAYYRLGATGRAAAAWLQARRLAPRAPSVRRALALTPPPDVDVGALDLVAAGHAGGAAAGRRRSAGSPAGSAGCSGRGCASGGRSCWSSRACAVFGGLALRAWYRRPARASCSTEPRSGSRRTAGRRRSRPLDGGSAVRIAAAHARAGSWCGRRAAAKAGLPTTRSPRSAARFSPCRAASPSCPTPSPTRSPRAKWSSARRRWSRSWWRTRSTPARGTCGWSSRTAARR